MSDYKEQKSNKPKIEDVINNSLKDSRKQDVLGLLDYIKSLKMKPQWASTNSWALSYKSKRVGYIKINDRTGDWELWLYALYDENFNELVSKENADVKNYFSSNIYYCFHCSACTPGKDIVFLGKELKNVCISPVIRVKNPDKSFLEFAQRQIVLRRSDIENGKVPKVTYIAMKNRK